MVGSTIDRTPPSVLMEQATTLLPCTSSTRALDISNVPFDFAGMLKHVDPDIVRYLPRTGSPIFDGLARMGLSTLIKSTRGADEDNPEGMSPEEFIDRCVRQQFGLYVVAGPRGSGKTSYSVWLAQKMGRPTYAINMPVTMSWIHQLEASQLGNISPGSTVILDDSGMVVSSRDYNTKVAEALRELVQLARHEEITLIANTAVTSLVNRYLLDCDAIFFKRPSEITATIERKGLEPLLRDVRKAFDVIPLDQEKGYIYAISGTWRYKGLIWYPLPDGYTASISANKAGRKKLKAPPVIVHAEIVDDDDEDGDA